MLRTMLRVGLCLLLTIVLGAAVNFAFTLLNLPSDLRFWTGVVLLTAMFVFGPSTYTLLLRLTRPKPSKENHSETTLETVNADSASAGS